MMGPAEREEAQDTINAVYADPAGPYFNPNDPRHGRAVEEMSKLFQIVNTPDAAERAPNATQNARAKINAIYADPAHPYHDRAHPGYQSARTEVPKLFETAYPGEPREAAK